MKRNKQHIPDELRRTVFVRDNYTCRYCGSKERPLHCDHVYPEARGGETSLDNLVTSCKPCNLKKYTRVGIWPLPLSTMEELTRQQEEAARKADQAVQQERTRIRYNYGQESDPLFSMPLHVLLLGSLTSLVLMMMMVFLAPSLMANSKIDPILLGFASMMGFRLLLYAGWKIQNRKFLKLLEE